MRSEKHISTKGDERKKRALQWVIIFLQIIIIIILLLNRCGMGEEEISSFSGTAVIQEAEMEGYSETMEGRMRICCNTTINVKNNVMQDLNFTNYNTDRLMRIEIVSGKNTIYSSEYIEYGKMIKGDFIDTSALKAGINDAVIMAYLYDSETNPLGQSNVEVRLIL